jgi:hypothetical protein
VNFKRNEREELKCMEAAVINFLSAKFKEPAYTRKVIKTGST